MAPIDELFESVARKGQCSAFACIPEPPPVVPNAEHGVHRRGRAALRSRGAVQLQRLLRYPLVQQAVWKPGIAAPASHGRPHAMVVNVRVAFLSHPAVDAHNRTFKMLRNKQQALEDKQHTG